MSLDEQSGFQPQSPESVGGIESALPLQPPLDVGVEQALPTDIESIPFGSAVANALRSIQARGTVDFKVGQAAHHVFGPTKVDNKTFRQFLDALNSSAHITYLGEGIYRFVQVEPVEVKPEPAPAPQRDLNSMIRSWKKEAPRARKKPHSRRRVHFKKGSFMDDYHIDPTADE